MHHVSYDSKRRVINNHLHRAITINNAQQVLISKVLAHTLSVQGMSSFYPILKEKIIKILRYWLGFHVQCILIQHDKILHRSSNSSLTYTYIWNTHYFVSWSSFSLYHKHTRIPTVSLLLYLLLSHCVASIICVCI